MFILLVLGMILDATPLILVTMPIFMPSMAALGVDFYTFYIIMVVAVGIGQLTPPVAIVLYVMGGVTGEPVTGILREALPYMMMLIVLLVIIILFPIIPTFIPSLM